MKNLIFVLAFCALALPTFAGSPADRFIDGLKNEKNTEYVKVPASLVKLGVMKEDIGISPDKLGGVKVLSIDKCDDNTLKHIEKGLEELNSDKYEKIIKTQDNDNTVSIFIQPDKKDRIRELLVVAIAKNDVSIVKINCKISREDIQKIVSMD